MAEQAGINVNPEVLLWARESLGISKAKAVESAKIELLRLNKLEGGQEKPSFKEIQALAKVYKRSPMVLLMQSPPAEKPLPPDFRSVDSREVDHFHEKTIIAIRKARAFAQSLVELKQDNGVNIPDFPFSATLQDNPGKIAELVRSYIKLIEIRQMETAAEALELAIEKVEDLGVAVFQLTLTQGTTEKTKGRYSIIRGFSLVDDVFPIIVLRRGGEWPSSKLFTLFHELGHIILNQGGICDMKDKPDIPIIEKWCNAFSAEMLVPTQDLLQVDQVAAQIGKGKKDWGKTKLERIGAQFHVGPLMILRRLLDNGLATKAYYQAKHDEWNKPAFARAKEPKGREIPKETIKEKGRTYVSLAFKSYDTNKIDLVGLADYLGVRFDYIPKTRELLSI